MTTAKNYAQIREMQRYWSPVCVEQEKVTSRLQADLPAYTIITIPEAARKYLHSLESFWLPVSYI